jgi:hypothetical protein
MGTFLAFAQQQAKDTGQDINYLVDSIVTGLGRKSLPILDNLGLSAEEIRNRMKGTGDMTQAVADIIKDRMKEAGDYIETAADRAAQSQVKLDNAMKELGDTMNSLSGAGATLWNDLKVGAIELANDAIKPLIKLFNELASYINGTSVEDILLNAPGGQVGSNVDDKGNFIKRPANGNWAGFDAQNGTWKEGYWGAIYNSATGQTEFPDIVIGGTRRTKTTTKGGRSGSTVKMPTWDDFAKVNIKTNQYLEQNLGKVLAEKEMPSVWAMFDQEGMKKMLGLNETQTFDLKKDITEKDYKKLLGIKEKDDNQVIDEMQKIFGGVQGIFGGIEQLGIELPEGLKNILSGIQGVMSIVQGITSILLVLETLNEAQTATSFIPFFARGGVLHAANGVVPGHKFSGDNIPALLNAGETVLTAAQTNTLASNLRNGGLGNMNLSATVSGEQIRFVLNSNGRRTGKGEYLQTNFVRT